MNQEKLTELLKADYSELYNAIDWHYMLEDASDLDELREKASDYIRESCEIIYYHKAIDYLKEHDPSLRESLDLAQDMGFEAKNLNSETLATLLYQQKLEQALGEFINEAEDLVLTEESE